MATWEKIKFLWNNILSISGSAITATSTASGYDVADVARMYEGDKWLAANTTSPCYINFDAGSGKITNGDFEAGDTSGWTLYVDTGAGASASFAASGTSPYEGSYKCAVTITAGGPNSTRIQMHQGSKPITNGKKQYVKFAARCAAGTRNIETVIQKDASPYTGYTAEGTQTLGLTTSWQVFDIVWTANTTASDARLALFLGGNDTDVDIDIVCWWEEGAVPLADSLVIFGHNFNEIGVQTVGLHYSDTNYASNTDAFTPFKPESAAPVYKEFTAGSVPHKYWRSYVTGTLSAAPQIKIMMLCQRAELDYASTSFAPNAQTDAVEVHKAYGGVVNGIFRDHVEREMSLSFHDVPVPDGWDSDATNLYYKLNAWRDGSGSGQFFVAWETANNPGDVFLMRPTGPWNNPLTNGGAFCDVTIDLKGRKS